MVTGSLAGSLTCGNHIGHTNLCHLASLCPNLGFRVLSYKRKLAWENLFFPFTLAVLWSQVTWDLTAQHCLSVPESAEHKVVSCSIEKYKDGPVTCGWKNTSFPTQKEDRGWGIKPEEGVWTAKPNQFSSFEVRGQAVRQRVTQTAWKMNVKSFGLYFRLCHQIPP